MRVKTISLMLTVIIASALLAILPKPDVKWESGYPEKAKIVSATDIGKCIVTYKTTVKNGETKLTPSNAWISHEDKYFDYDNRHFTHGTGEATVKEDASYSNGNCNNTSAKAKMRVSVTNYRDGYTDWEDGKYTEHFTVDPNLPPTEGQQ